MGPFRFTSIPHAKASTDLTEREVSIDELRELLTTHEVGDKDGPSIVPALFKPCPALCRKPTKANRKGCGGGQAHRLAANVHAVTMFAADLDDVAESAMVGVLDRLDALGVLYFVWTTHSHTPQSPRWRVVVPFAAPLPIANPEQWSKGVWPKLVGHFGLSGVASVDPSCKDPSRLYYLPRHVEGQEAETLSRGDVLFDPATVVGDLDALVRPTPRLDPVPSSVAEDASRPVDVAALRAKVKARREPLATYCANVAAGRPVAPPTQDRETGELSRNDAWFRVLGVLSLVAEDWMSTEALLEVVRPAFDAEVKQDPDGHTQWDRIESMLAAQRSTAPSRRAQRAAEREAKRDAQRRLFDRILTKKNGRVPGGASTQPAEGDGETDDGAEEGEAEPAAWTVEEIRDALDVRPGKANPDGSPVYAGTIRNALLVLSSDPDWKGGIRYNQLRGLVEVHPCQAYDDGVRPIHDRDLTWMRVALSQGAYALHVSKDDLRDAVEAVAHANEYQPVVDYLNALTWDGIARVETWLETYMHAVTEEAGEDLTSHVRAVGKRWLISAVARAFEPGCKADSMLHLEGEQRIRKTTALEVLGGPWYLESTSRFDRDDTLVVIASAWIVELGELTSFGKADENLQKSFIARRVDTIVRKWEKYQSELPRRCVFAGTTNQDDYLSDVTGNRRHWTCRVKGASPEDITALRRDRDQLWAEAVVMYRAGFGCPECARLASRCGEHRWWLTDEEENLAAKEAAKRVRSEVLDEQVAQWLMELEPAKRPRWVTVADIVKGVPDAARKTQRALTEMLRRLRFTRRTLSIPLAEATERQIPRVAKRWVTPDAILKAPKMTSIATEEGRRLRAADLTVAAGMGEDGAGEGGAADEVAGP